MGLRLLCLALLAPLLALAAIVFEAAFATEFATTLAVSASTTNSPMVRQRLLERAEEGLNQSWAQPTRWHAGAAEALSAIYFLKAETAGDAALFEQSARWATHTIRLAPVQPNAWIRLAALAERGYGNPLCDMDQCLERSWSVASMLEPETACARLQMAHRRNLLTPNDARIEAYLHGGAPRGEAARCLSFLPPDQLFQTLLRALGSD